MIDLTNATMTFSDYEGSELKFALIYNGQPYMIKLPDPARGNKLSISYINNQFSEDIGSKIFKSLGIPTQDTFLAKYTDKKGTVKIVVACKDFRQPGEQLYEADKFAKGFVSSQDMSKSRYEDIKAVFDIVQQYLPSNESSEERFWDTFVADALIGNKDRHMGNWGFLASDRKHLKLAPVYDCGSSLASLLSDEAMSLSLETLKHFHNDEFNIASIISINGKRVFYHELFKQPIPELKAATLRIVPKIDLAKIKAIINDTPEMSSIRKEYLCKAVEMRYQEILLPALKRLNKEKLKE